jgi:hypothetical protein|tara:strand:- start:11516 stop:12190 length:675 start_codon:yes stop_codon:yes gene_type:complete
MSVKLMNRVWKHSRAKGTARLVLLAIADHCNTAGVAWPSLTRLASYVNVNRRNTINAINQLVKMGELTRVHNGQTGRATTYKVTLGSVATDTGVATDTSVGGDTGGVSEETPQPPLNRQESLLGESNFDAFWKAYPKKVGKGAAVKAYDKALKGTPHDIIMEGLERYDPDPGYICNPATWLNEMRYFDEPTDYTKTARRNQDRQGGGEIIDAYSRFINRRETIN